jgi:hypothetical protein
MNNCKYGQTESDTVKCPSHCGCDNESQLPMAVVLFLAVCIIVVITLACFLNGVVL